MRNIRKFQQGGTTDKVKQFRDRHPVLDILAGFIPGVGQAQSVQDFGYAVKNKDAIGMGLASLGLIPFIGGFGKAGRLLSKVDDLAEVGSSVVKGASKAFKNTKELIEVVKNNSRTDLSARKTLEMLQENLTKDQAKKFQKLASKRNLTGDEHTQITELAAKYLKNAKYKKGSNDGIIKAQEAAKNQNQRIAKKYKELLNGEEASELAELSDKAKKDFGLPVDWNWFSGGILAESNIPPRVAMSKAIINGVEDTEPIMKRFLTNMADSNGLIQKRFQELVKKKILVPRGNNWTAIVDGKLYKVDPARFVLNHILQNDLKSTNIIPFAYEHHNGAFRNMIPWHGTNLSDSSVIPTYNNPTLRPLFTTIEDGTPGFDKVKSAYGTGASIPVMRKISKLEAETLTPNGLSSNSNNYGEVGELMNHFQGNGGKAQKVMDVSDAKNIKGNTGQRQNEYNFGTNTPDVKFLLNTFNFDGGKGAFTLKKGGKVKLVPRKN